VATFSGATRKSTTPFTIDASATSWKIRWRMNGAGNNAIGLKWPPDEYEALVVNTIGPTNDESTYCKAGTFFLDVTADGPWSVLIVESFT
jgi:hypothetical protein